LACICSWSCGCCSCCCCGGRDSYRLVFVCSSRTSRMQLINTTRLFVTSKKKKIISVAEGRPMRQRRRATGDDVCPARRSRNVPAAQQRWRWGTQYLKGGGSAQGGGGGGQFSHFVARPYRQAPIIGRPSRTLPLGVGEGGVPAPAFWRSLHGKEKS